MARHQGVKGVFGRQRRRCKPPKILVVSTLLRFLCYVVPSSVSSSSTFSHNFFRLLRGFVPGRNHLVIGVADTRGSACLHKRY